MIWIIIIILYRHINYSRSFHIVLRSHSTIWISIQNHSIFSVRHSSIEMKVTTWSIVSFSIRITMIDYPSETFLVVISSHFSMASLCVKCCVCILSNWTHNQLKSMLSSSFLSINPSNWSYPWTSFFWFRSNHDPFDISALHPGRCYVAFL